MKKGHTEKSGKLETDTPLYTLKQTPRFPEKVQTKTHKVKFL